MKTLIDLNIAESGRVLSISGKGKTRQHLLDMGVIPGTVIKMIKYAPMGDPIEFRLRGYSLTLRKDDAKTIKIEPCEEEIINKEDIIKINNYHPGLGESGYLFHDKKTENPLNDNEIISFALVGNQNSGKTTLFNQLTGSNQHVGNFPGVTVDRKDGPIKNNPNTIVTDLPGIYSMSPYTPEELVTRNFVLDERPKGIINILDATTLERGLYLTMQLLELDIPMVVALNMMDEMRNNGGYIDINGLEEKLGVPVVPISAAKNEGIDELIEHAIHVAKYQEKPLITDYCDVNDNNGAVHRCLHAIMHIIEDHSIEHKLPIRFCASKCAEGDKLIIEKLGLDKNHKETIEHISKQMEIEADLDKAAAIADMRYSFIHKVTKDNVINPSESIESKRSNKIDKLLTGKYTAILMFILIMLTVFFLTFEVIGPFFENILDSLITSLMNKTNLYLHSLDVNDGLISLIIDGIFSGVGSIISFLPIIIVLFFFLSILEDSGYMARIAFVMDKLLRKIGLSGRSIVPMLMGFGCTVPGVMSARTLPSERDRKLTILLTPFMSCSAKLPIYTFLTLTFFKKYQTLVMICLYLLGIIMAIVTAKIFNLTIFKGEAVPFVMELPNYRLPSLKNVSQLLWEKAKDFLQRAFTVIFIATIIIWFMQHFSFNLSMVSQEESILASIANIITPIFKPLGFNDWRIIVALITGFLAKESVVSTINVLFEANSLLAFLTPKAAISLLVFCLLYTPCIAAIAAIKKELGNKYAIIVVIFQCILAWLISFIVYSLIMLI